MWTSSALSISSSMPVILPARSGNMRWMRGNNLSPSICFCSWGGAAASIVAVKGSWPWTSTACWGGGAPPGATICPGITWAGGLRAVGVYLKLCCGRTWAPTIGTGGMPGLAIMVIGCGPGWFIGLGCCCPTLGPPTRGPRGPTPPPMPIPPMPMPGIPPGLGTDLGGSEEALGLGHRGHEVASHAHLLHATHLLHPHASHPLDVLGSKVSLPVLLSLREGNIEGLGNDDPSVHLSDGLGGLLGRREANKTKAFAAPLFVHHLGAGDCPVGSKLLPQSLVVDGVVEVLDVEVDALVSVQPLQLQLLKLLLQLLLTLSLLLGSPDVQGLAEHLDSVELVHGFLSGLAVFEVLDVHVGELLGLLSQLLLPLLAGHKPPHKDLLDGVHGGLLRLKMNEAVAFGATVGILCNLAAEDVSEGREGVVHRLVVDALVQVLDEDVADTAPPKGRVTLAPHDTDGTSLEHVKVHRVEGTFGISGLLEVDVGVSKRAPGDHVPAHADGEDRPRRGELLKEHRLGDLRGEIATVERGHGVVGPRLLALLPWGGPCLLSSLLCCCLLHRCHFHSLAKYNFADGQFNRSLFPVFSF